MCDNDLIQAPPSVIAETPTLPTTSRPGDDIVMDFGPPLPPPDLGPVVVPTLTPWTDARRPLVAEPSELESGRSEIMPVTPVSGSSCAAHPAPSDWRQRRAAEIRRRWSGETP